MANNCLNWKSKEVEELAKQVGLEKSTPAFADKIGTLMDKLGISSINEIPTLIKNKVFDEVAFEYNDGSGKDNLIYTIASIKNIEDGQVIFLNGATYSEHGNHIATIKNGKVVSFSRKYKEELIPLDLSVGNLNFKFNDISDPSKEQLIILEQVKEYLEISKPKSVEKGKVVNPQGLAYAQCRLPALWKELFDDQFWMNKDGDIDFNKVDKHLPDLLKAFGYRIPNEDKYSSLPLRVTGFLPTGSGGAIMLPAEITTISGSDFDVDKMYVIIKKLVLVPILDLSNLSNLFGLI